ncbi:hypothetical protein BGX38DRAFT_1329936 [Terfezia claveryi]|nr:hypothetical protein BGX38DRAFT_1329936 [Terfezia claveryi]
MSEMWECCGVTYLWVSPSRPLPHIPPDIESSCVNTSSAINTLQNANRALALKLMKATSLAVPTRLRYSQPLPPFSGTLSRPKYKTLRSAREFQRDVVMVMGWFGKNRIHGELVDWTMNQQLLPPTSTSVPKPKPAKPAASRKRELSPATRDRMAGLGTYGALNITGFNGYFIVDFLVGGSN